MRGHMIVRIENAGLVDDIARLDAGCLDDEFGGEFDERRRLAGRDGVCVRGIGLSDIGVEGRNQFVVRDRLRRRVEAGSAYG